MTYAMRRYVFVSHANDDKPAIKGLVVSLLDAGIPLWIDRPEDVGLDERHLNCGRIVAGADWQQEIRRGLENCSCVLFVLSRASNSTARSDELFREYKFGEERQRLVIAQIERIEASELNPFIRIRQVIDLSNRASGVDPRSALQARYEVLVDRLREHLISEPAGNSSPILEKRIGNSIDINGASHRPRRLLPYLTDRADQQRRITTALQAQLDRRLNKPMTFFALGTYDDCVVSFVERVGRVRLPLFLESNALNSEVLFRSLRWPLVEGQTSWAGDDTAALFEDIKNQVHDALAVKVTADKAMIERKLANTPASWFFDIKIDLAGWNVQQLDLMLRWLRWLHQLDLSRTHYPIVTLVSIVYPTGLLRGLLWQKALLRLRRDIKGLANEPELGSSVNFLPELRTVRFEDVEQWIREYAEDYDHEVLRRRLRRHFSMLGLRERRLSMYRTADLVREALNDPATRLSMS